MKTLSEKAKGVIDASSEWRDFETAIQSRKPAVETFTNQALMLIYLALGREALK